MIGSRIVIICLSGMVLNCLKSVSCRMWWGLHCLGGLFPGRCSNKRTESGFCLYLEQNKCLKTETPDTVMCCLLFTKKEKQPIFSPDQSLPQTSQVKLCIFVEMPFHSFSLFKKAFCFCFLQCFYTPPHTPTHPSRGLFCDCCGDILVVWFECCVCLSSLREP